MRCYVKDRATFQTLGVYSVAEKDYEIYFETLFDDLSKLTLLTSDKIDEDNIVYCDNGWFGVIKSAVRDEEKAITKLTCRHIRYLFERPVSVAECSMLPDFGFTMERMLKDAITSLFSNQSDNVYKLPYISFVLTSANNAFGVMPLPDTTDGIWKLSEYLLKMQRTYRIFCTYDIRRVSGADTLRISIGELATAARKIDFSQKSNRLIKENYSNDALAKISLFEGVTSDTWYLKTDGTIVDAEPAAEDRAVGNWITIFYDGADIEQKALDEFAKNKFSHSIKFSSPRLMNIYDPVELRINGNVVNSEITSILLTGETDKYIYTSGELRTRFSDKVKELFV